MSLLRNLAAGMRALFRKEQIEREMDEELRACLESAVEEKLRAGLSHDEALRAARVEFGSLESVKEDVRQAGWERLLEDLWQDFRYGARMLAKSPGFTLVAVVTLALGIGANTAVFSVVNTLLLRPLPIEEPARFVRLYTGVSHTSYPDYQEFQQLDNVFSGLLAHHIVALNFGEGESIERVLGDLVSGNYFELLGVRAQRGRTFSPEVDGPRGEHAVAVISHGLWKRRFNANPDIVGRAILLNRQRFEIIGVTPEGFHGTFNFAIAPEVWVPLSMQPVLFAGADPFADRGRTWLEIFGRLKPGVDVAQADAASRVLGQQLAQEYPQQSPRIEHTEVYPMIGANALRGLSKGATIFTFVGMVMALVGLILLIACANLANLQLARGAARRKELAVRLALGGTRMRLVRQLLTESLILSLVAGAAACLIVLWGTSALRAWTPPLPETLEFDLRIDWRVLAFSLCASLLTAVLFGLFPALQVTRVDVMTQVKDGAPHGVEGASFARMVPLTISSIGFSLEIEGYEPVDGENPNVSANMVGARYFEVMGIPVLAGREFTRRDTLEAPRVVMINQTMARRYWSDGNVIGKRLKLLQFGPKQGPWMEVIGVVEDSKYSTPGEGPTSVLYLAGEQNFEPETTLHVRTAGVPSTWAPAVRRAILGLDGTLLAQTVTLRDQTALGLLPSRIAAALFGGLGALGMALALVGVHGVVAFVVVQRTREIGLRMALGGQPRDVLALVLGRGLRLALIGIAGGALVAVALRRVLESLLVGVSPSDPATYAVVAASLVVAVLLACYVPARRASRVDPMVALRHE